MRPILVVGSGGHAKVLVDALLSAGIRPLGLTDQLTDRFGHLVLGVEILGDDSIIEQHDPTQIQLVNGIGSIKDTGTRRRVFERFKARGFEFARVVHPGAIVSPHADLAEGAQVLAGAVVQPGSRIGSNAIVNTRASVDHDCRVGAHVHLAPGVTLSGGVSIGDGAHVGTGATVIQGISLGAECLVAAGAVVVRDVTAGDKVSGIPARGGKR